MKKLLLITAIILGISSNAQAHVKFNYDFSNTKSAYQVDDFQGDTLVGLSVIRKNGKIENVIIITHPKGYTKKEQAVVSYVDSDDADKSIIRVDSNENAGFKMIKNK